MSEEIENTRRKKTAYDCFLYICYEEFCKAYPDEIIDFTELSKRCSKRWKYRMNDEQKARFLKIATEERVRIQSGKRSLLKVKRKLKRPSGKPKHPLCGYFWFSVHKRPQVKKDNPSFTATDVIKELSKLWANADIEVKRTYEALADEDKRRYAREMAIFRNKMVNEDDSENDLENGTKMSPSSIEDKTCSVDEVHEISDSD